MQEDAKTIGNSFPTYTHLKSALLDNMVYFQGEFAGCADFVCRDFVVCGHRMEVLTIDNMVDKLTLNECVLLPLTSARPPAGAGDVKACYRWIRDMVLSASDAKESFTYEETVQYMMAGFAVLLFDGVDAAVAVGLQGFKYRSIEEPNLETVLRGSREGFVEALRINLSMVRRRIKNPALKFETYILGSESKTEVCIAYIKDVANDEILESIRKRLFGINIETVLASGFLQSYFQDHPYSIFSTVGTTERPDTLCGKLTEGRVGILVDGTPLALYTPFLFVENFQNIDDYAVGTYYAFFTRFLKFLAFFVSVLVPGLYVAIGSFHPQLLPSALLMTLATSEEATPFPLVIEALIMQVTYELIREAGLRLPKQIGFAINIVGALIIGQAAVAANLIGAPMVIVVSLTATTSLVTPTLYEPGIVLRFLFIFLAGMSGLYGITLGIIFVLYHICSIKTYDIPFTAPVAPFELFSMRDVLIRAPWKILGRKKKQVDQMPGSNVDQTQG